MASAVQEFNEDAFDAAMDVFYDTLRSARRMTPAMLPCEFEEARVEAEQEALEAFLGTYMEVADAS